MSEWKFHRLAEIFPLIDRAMVGAKIATLKDGQRADLVQGLPIGRAAEIMKVSERSIARAKEVLAHGASELVAKIELGQMAVSAAANVVKRAAKPSVEAAPMPKIGDAVKMNLKGNRATLVSWMRQHHDAGIPAVLAAFAASVVVIERHLDG